VYPGTDPTAAIVGAIAGGIAGGIVGAIVGGIVGGSVGAIVGGIVGASVAAWSQQVPSSDGFASWLHTSPAQDIEAALDLIR
jgi:uncharacterized membrane protein